MNNSIKNKQIQKIMKRFDWNCVHKTMINLDWKWYKLSNKNEMIYEVPSIKQMKSAVKNELFPNIKENGDYCATGGFVARMENNGISLTFELTGYEIVE